MTQQELEAGVAKWEGAMKARAAAIAAEFGVAVMPPSQLDAERSLRRDGLALMRQRDRRIGGAAPKRRGRPPGSKNKPAAPVASKPPSKAATAPKAAKAPVAAPATAPAKSGPVASVLPRVLAAFAKGQQYKTAELRGKLGMPKSSFANALTDLVRSRQINRVASGVYERIG